MIQTYLFIQFPKNIVQLVNDNDIIDIYFDASERDVMNLQTTIEDGGCD